MGSGLHICILSKYVGTSFSVWRSVFNVMFKQVLNKEVINENTRLDKSIL